jgi:hypothetical protein
MKNQYLDHPEWPKVALVSKKIEKFLGEKKIRAG